MSICLNRIRGLILMNGLLYGLIFLDNDKIWFVLFGGLNMNLDSMTSIKVNSTKKQLAKDKGLKLQDLLDTALNIALGLESKEYDTNTILIEIEETKKKILDLEETKKVELNRISKEYDTKINELKLKLELLDIEYGNLDELKITNKIKEQQKKDYLELREKYIELNGDYKGNEDLEEAIATYVILYAGDEDNRQSFTKEVLNDLHKEQLAYEEEVFKI